MRQNAANTIPLPAGASSAGHNRSMQNFLAVFVSRALPGKAAPGFPSGIASNQKPRAMKRFNEIVNGPRRLVRRSVCVVIAASVLALGFSGCGRKGPLEPHPADVQSRKANDAGVAPTAPRRFSLGGRDKRRTPVSAPDRPFILDALL